MKKFAGRRGTILTKRRCWSMRRSGNASHRLAQGTAKQQMIAGQPHFSTSRAQRVSICVVIALLLAGNSAALRSEQINADRIQILKVISQVRDAGISRDVAMIEKLHANDYFHTNADGSVMTKAEMVASYKISNNYRIQRTPRRHSPGPWRCRRRERDGYAERT